MYAYLRALKNTQVQVTGREPLAFTVNGCASLPEFRERLFDQQLGALEYCAELLQAREANAGKIKTLLAVLRGIRNTILVDKDERPRRPPAPRLRKPQPLHVINKLTLTERQFQFLDRFHTDLERTLLSCEYPSPPCPAHPPHVHCLPPILANHQ